MCLDLAHGRDVPLRDLMMILHVVLQRLIIVVLDLLLRDRPDFVILLVSLIVRLCHGNLVLRVEGQFGVRTFQLGHERRR